MFASGKFRNRLQELSAQSGQQPDMGAPKGFIGKILNSPKLDAGQRASIMASMNPRGARLAGPMSDRSANVNAFAKGGKAKKMAKGGSTASKRADGCATKGKTKGRFV